MADEQVRKEQGASHGPAPKSGDESPHSKRFAAPDVPWSGAKRLECVRFSGAFWFMVTEQVRKEQVAFHEPAPAGKAGTPLPVESRGFPSLQTRSGDRSVVLHWDTTGDTTGWIVERAVLAPGTSSPLAWHAVTPAPLHVPRWADLAATNGVTYRYRVRELDDGLLIPHPDGVPAVPAVFRTDDEFLDLVMATAFDYFWREANPANGLVKDRSTTHSFCSIAATGFGLTALSIGVDHGWIDRKQAAERVLTTLRTFWRGAQGGERSGVIGHRGWFYHFLDMQQTTRYRQVELSSIDTALFLAGALDAGEYFGRADATESEIRWLAKALLERVDWRWMTDGQDTLTMGWHPETGFIRSRWVGYNEAMVLYILAMGAPQGGLGAEAWEGWTRGYRWATHHGHSYVEFAPLFGHQYSHCWIDFRGLADAYLRGRGLDYFENSRRATLANRAYATANPKGWRGYGTDCWGLTACDGPGFAPYHGYMARGAPPAENDDGTIAPTAAGSSIPFAPAECIAALRYMYDTYREQLWTPFGFRDAFNVTAGWWDPDVLGIDQGPMLIMIENHRTGRVWKRFMQNEVIQRGLQRAGIRRLNGSP